MTEIAVIGLEGAWSSEVLVDAFRSKGAKCSLVNMARVSLDSSPLSVRCETAEGTRNLLDFDAVFVKKIGPSYSPHMLDRLEILRVAEARGVVFCSRPSRILRLLDRLACTATLLAHEIPMPPTVVTEDVSFACETIERFGSAILKPLYSTKARGMQRIEWTKPARVEDSVRSFIAEGNPNVYLQKQLALSGRDLGVVFLNGEYVGNYARVGSAKSWNTTIHEGGAYEAADPGDEIIELARRAQEPFGLDFTCVDVAITADGPVIFEVSAFGGFRGLRDGLDIDAADLVTDHVLNKLSAPSA